MQLQNTVQPVFEQLINSLLQLREDQYSDACSILSNASIGAHTRHIVELFQCLEQGYETGLVNYEMRKRDIRIEQDKDLAIALLNHLLRGLAKPNKQLVLEGAYHEHAESLLQIETNYYREIVYNLEHAIHHMALIKIGLKEFAIQDIPENYGVASSTIKFRKACVQ